MASYSGKLVFLCLILLVAQGTSLEEKATVKKLMDSLLKSYDPNNYAAVPKVKNKTQTVHIVVVPETLYGLDENEIFQFSFWMIIYWTDERLAWKTQDWNNITEVYINTDQIWQPDVSIWKNKDLDYNDISLLKSRRSKVTSAGVVRVQHKLLPQVPCPSSTDFFPFDIQSCEVTFGTYVSKYKDFKLSMRTIEKSKTTDIGQWSLLRVDKRKKCISSYAKDYPCAQMVVHMRRKSQFYMAFVFLPCLLISAVQVMVFIANKKIHRVGIGLTIIMAVTLIVLMSANSAPKTLTEIPLLAVYFFVQMSLIIAFTVVGLVNVVKKENSGEPSTNPGKSFSRRDSLSLCIYTFVTFVNALTCFIFIPSAIQPGKVE